MSLKSVTRMLASLAFLASTSAFAAPMSLTVDVAGIQSHGFLLEDPDNTVLNYNVGANSTITSVNYSINLTAFSPSWLADIGLLFTDSNVFNGVIWTPGFGDTGPGTASYSGTLDLVAEGLDFAVGADGILRLEFYEDWDDLAGADGQWNFGTISFNYETLDDTGPGPSPVPEPATALLFAGGLGLIGYGRRRRNAPQKGTSIH